MHKEKVKSYEGKSTPKASPRVFHKNETKASTHVRLFQI